jgi:zinc/manganese transport system permease protein
VTASVQLVGVYLVFASLIIPALATRHLVGKRRLLAGYILGAAAFTAGIMMSALFDLPTGAVTVWTMAGLAVITGTWLGYRFNRS